jgi:hypothetical protein
MQNKEVEESVLWLVVNNRKAEVGSTEEHFQLVRQSFEKTFGSKDSRDTVRALDFAFDMQSAHDESDHNSSIIDFALKLEIARVGARSIGEKRFAAYLADLLSLAEEAKLQIEQYVSSKAVIETFVLSWWQLRQTCGC